MKKLLFLSATVVSSLLLVTGCSSSEDTEDSPQSNAATVSLDVQADVAASTRAISDGSGANELFYRVFDKDGNIISDQLPLKQENASDLLTGHKVTLQLIKGQTYKIAFWAQNSACTAYSVDDNMNVTVDYSGANNDETRDAFFKTVDVAVTGDMNVDVTLKRPFAQINVGSSANDWDGAVASGLTVTTSTVTVKDAATKLNIITGKVSDPEDVTYTASAIPAESLLADADGDGTKETYHYLSMCYILPDEATTGASKTTVSTAFTFAPETGKGNPVTLNEGLQAIPVQRNYRTNIVGRILTGEVNFKVTVDPDFICNREVDLLTNVWDGKTYTEPSVADNAYQINTEAELAWVFNQRKLNGHSLSINNNLNMGNHEFYGRINVDAANLELNGNGHTICFFKLANNDSSNHNEDFSMGLFKGDALSYDFTVKDIQFKDVSAINNYTDRDDSYGYAGILFGDIQDGKTVTFNNVKIHNCDLFGTSAIAPLVGLVATNCTANINNCEVECASITNRNSSGSGYVAGLVGRPNGKVNITNSKVWKTTIDAYYAPKYSGLIRNTSSIDELVGDRTGGWYKSNVQVDDATVKNSTGEEAINYINKHRH